MMILIGVRSAMTWNESTGWEMEEVAVGNDCMESMGADFWCRFGFGNTKGIGDLEFDLECVVGLEVGFGFGFSSG